MLLASCILLACHLGLDFLTYEVTPLKQVTSKPLS